MESVLGLYKVLKCSPNAKTESVLFSCFLWVWFRNPPSNITFAENLILEAGVDTRQRITTTEMTKRSRWFCCSSCFKLSENTANMFVSENQDKTLTKTLSALDNGSLTDGKAIWTIWTSFYIGKLLSFGRRESTFDWNSLKSSQRS